MMKHVCVASGIGDGKAPGAGNIKYIHQPGNAGSADSGCNPAGNISSNKQLSPGLARVLAPGFVPPLAHIRDMRCGPLLAMSQNRDSAARVSLC
jgi:hypothetical protein